MQIILVRHAKVLMPDPTPLYASEMRAWVHAYDHAPIEIDIPHKEQLVALATQSACLVCSGHGRSIGSLALLGAIPERQERIFDEVAVPSVNWRGVKLAPKVWLVLFRIASLFGYRGGGESLSDAKVRAVLAVDRLVDFSAEAESTLLLGHGLMNRFIAKELKRRGWRESRALGRANWSYGIFELEKMKDMDAKTDQ